VFIIICLASIVLLLFFVEPIRSSVVQFIRYDTTMRDSIKHYGPAARLKLKPLFEKQSIAYPPKKLTLIGIKNERLLEVWASKDQQWLLIKKYPLTAFSGVLGPKLRQGDKQIPEGLYRLNAFNPNSRYHLSLRINYPNEFDLKHAKIEKRIKPGKNIFIHGRAASVGCLAIGDLAIEELFVLVADTGKENVAVILSPLDFRKKHKALNIKGSSWLPQLYKNIKKAFIPFGLNGENKLPDGA